MGSTSLFNPKVFFAQTAKSLKSLLLPPICYHCGSGVFSQDWIFCNECLIQLEPLDSSERCPRCFEIKGKRCGCRKLHGIDALGAVFSTTGPASTLLKTFIHHKQLHLSKGIAAYFIYQIIQLNWPIPDLILLPPISTLEKYQLGFHPELLVAEDMTTLFERDIQVYPWKKDGLPSNHRQMFYQKKILLLDVYSKPDFSISHIARDLTKGLPKKIYAMQSVLNPSFFAEEKKHSDDRNSHEKNQPE